MAQLFAGNCPYNKLGYSFSSALTTPRGRKSQQCAHSLSERQSIWELNFLSI